jgi:hypothetical protein
MGAARRRRNLEMGLAEAERRYLQTSPRNRTFFKTGACRTCGFRKIVGFLCAPHSADQLCHLGQTKKVNLRGSCPSLTRRRV